VENGPLEYLSITLESHPIDWALLNTEDQDQDEQGIEGVITSARRKYRYLKSIAAKIFKARELYLRTANDYQCTSNTCPIDEDLRQFDIANEHYADLTLIQKTKLSLLKDIKRFPVSCSGDHARPKERLQDILSASWNVTPTEQWTMKVEQEAKFAFLEVAKPLVQDYEEAVRVCPLEKCGLERHLKHAKELCKLYETDIRRTQMIIELWISEGLL
jgi:hypothetical protein